ncbi:MBL fold metallo-hydrolase [Actinopolymorpha alba]|uniref:MBL fold metallo-hydrolase n=1 Tax=Actinopolymorpha alba TaxID=533267 RepID=UPI001ED98797|nr:MBL fold metallo-hydrolase [Actinopolymorpha alba]
MNTRATGWTEVGPGCFARRYPSFDVTVGVVVGADGLLVVDTRGSLGEADELRADLVALSSAPVRWVVDTHWHFDHCFGNARFTEAAIYGHETVPEMLATEAEAVRASLAERSPEWAREMGELVVVPPSRTFSSVAVVDLGDRQVELVHPGRGHTAGDVAARVPDADVVYVGDLIEESGPPMYGEDSFPLEWPATLDLLTGLLTERTAVVPGHGAVVDRAFAQAQRIEVSNVAETVRHLAAEGVPVDKALDAGEWPYPRESLAHAVRRGYEHLGSTGAGRRSLPLLPP